MQIQPNKERSIIPSDSTFHFTKCKSCKKVLFSDILLEHKIGCLDLEEENGSHVEKLYLKILGLNTSGAISTIASGIGDDDFERILKLLTPEIKKPLEFNTDKPNDVSAAGGVTSRAQMLCKLAKCKQFRIRISPITSFQH